MAAQLPHAHLQQAWGCVMRAALAAVVCVVVSASASAQELELAVSRQLGVGVALPITRELLATPDGGVIVVGDGFVRAAGPGRVVTRVFATKLAADGAVVWSLNWGDPEAGQYGAVATGAQLIGGEVTIAAQTAYDQPPRAFAVRVGPNGVVTSVAAAAASAGDSVTLANGTRFTGTTSEPDRDFALTSVRSGGAPVTVTIGGSSDDQLWSIAARSTERVIAVGRTLGIGAASELSDFPYVNPLRPFGGGADATLVALQGTTVVTATPWGGNALDAAYGVAMAPGGGVVVVGETYSTDFPLSEPLFDSGSSYATWFDDDLSAITYSTRLGADMQQAQRVVVDSAGRSVIAGRDSNAGLRLMWVSAAADAFVTGGGNDWWLEVDVAFAARSVDVQIGDGPWLPLRKQAWGTWAESYFAPSGSIVRFRALSQTSEQVASRDYLWPHGVPVPRAADFAASFIEPRGNAWWVEVDVAANRELAAVEARIGEGAWLVLPRTAWGSFAASHQVPTGSRVQFRARSVDGQHATSLLMPWSQ